MSDFEARIDYVFRNPELMTEALTHSSYGYEHNCPHNERLEFLGDSILGYVVSRELFTIFPEKDEGTLSKLKSVLVSSRTLARLARELNIGVDLRLGKGEGRAGGRQKSSILADAIEAVIGALSVDGGLPAAEAFIHLLFKDEIKNATIDIKNKVDFKTLLQERLQELGFQPPHYRLELEEGPPHKRTFGMRTEVGDMRGPLGTGSSKKSAQQEAARKLLEDKGFWDKVHSASDVSAQG